MNEQELSDRQYIIDISYWAFVNKQTRDRQAMLSDIIKPLRYIKKGETK